MEYVIIIVATLFLVGVYVIFYFPAKKELLSVEELKTLANSCVMDVNLSDEMRAEYEKKSKLLFFEFKSWLEKNMGKMYLNLAVLARASGADEDYTFSRIFFKVIAEKKWRLNGGCWEVEKLLISINTKGESNCLSLFGDYYFRLIQYGGDLSNNAYNVVIRDQRFNAVKEEIEIILDRAYRYWAQPYKERWIKMKEEWS